MYDELTQVDIDKMKAELEHRRLELRPKLIEDVQTARAFGDLSENYEYKAAKQLEYAMNDFGFKPERFAQALPYFHKTLEQTFFRTVKASITAMAGRDPRCIDDRNRASYEMCQTLASMLEDTRLPFI